MCLVYFIKFNLVPLFYSAGIGVLNAARKTMARLLGNTESAFESARSQFWVVDAMVCGRLLLLLIMLKGMPVLFKF